MRLVYLKDSFYCDWFIQLSDYRLSDYKLSDYMIGNQLVGNIRSFKPIKFEKSVIFIIITAFTIILSLIILIIITMILIKMIIIASIRTKPSKVSMTSQK